MNRILAPESANKLQNQNSSVPPREVHQENSTGTFWTEIVRRIIMKAKQGLKKVLFFCHKSWTGSIYFIMDWVTRLNFSQEIVKNNPLLHTGK
jgi:hypothetical protein